MSHIRTRKSMVHFQEGCLGILSHTRRQEGLRAERNRVACIDHAIRDHQTSDLYFQDNQPFLLRIAVRK